MGLKDVMGIKQIKLNIKGDYTIAQLYQAIKDAGYGEAGYPKLVKHGPVDVIVWPEVDRNNQVWVIAAGKGKFVCQRSTVVAGLGNMVVNELVNDLHDLNPFDFSNQKSILGGPKKICMARVDIVADTINGLGL